MVSAVTPRNGAADDGVDKLKTLSPGQRFHLDPAVTKLTMTTGLFFVSSLNSDFLFYGFSIGDFRGFQYGFDVKFPFEPFDGGFDMNLAQTGQKDFFGFGNSIQF